MAERKVLNKYIPPDFDPALIPRVKRIKNRQITVRLMAPFSMRCETCGDYIYKGKKFNARKEDAVGEAYLGIQIYRFYIRCPKCAAEITFKTDPKNSDYVCELGAKRNFEPWREEQKIEEEAKATRAEEEEHNPMKALENRTLDTKKEMDVLDALDEIRTQNARREHIDAQRLVEVFQERELQSHTVDSDEDEKLVQAVFGNGKSEEVYLEDIISEDDSDNDDDWNMMDKKTYPHPINQLRSSST
jgi:hypothetical protein